jgi:hypothetical protein
MTLADFFLAVNHASIRLANVGGQLQLRGPTNAITPEIQSGAAEHKAAILELLPPAPNQDAAEIEIDEFPDGELAEPGFRHDHDWRDWRYEWLLELAKLHLRMRDCQDAEVLARLRPLAGATPTSLAEWLALGQQISSTEYELRRQGKLPSFPWPERGT